MYCCFYCGFYGTGETIEKNGGKCPHCGAKRWYLAYSLNPPTNPIPVEDPEPES